METTETTDDDARDRAPRCWTCWGLAQCYVPGARYKALCRWCAGDPPPNPYAKLTTMERSLRQAYDRAKARHAATAASAATPPKTEVL